LETAAINVRTAGADPVSVFRGHVDGAYLRPFDDDGPVHQAVQVALRRFKVVLWYDSIGALRANA